MTRALFLAVLYVAFGFGANPAAAEMPDRDALLALRAGDMRKLAIHETAKAVPEVELLDMAGEAHLLAEARGKTVLLNFWATWCAPCRKEMPALDRLQADLGGADFEVILVAVGRNPPPAIKKFFTEAGIEKLATWRDPKQKFASEVGVFGLPVTVLLNPEGEEFARMQGDADWHSAEALTLLRAMLGRAEE